MAEVITLTDPEAGSEAKILVSTGFNCFSFRVPWQERVCDLLWAEPDFESGQCRPTGSGIPLLFPFAGRLDGTQLVYEGRHFELEPADQFGNPIHGFVYTRPWRVIEQTASSAVGEFHASRDDPALLAQWPADFCSQVRYTVSGASLDCQVAVSNPDQEQRTLPFGFGTHAYFRLPVGGAGNVASQQVTAPVDGHWELTDLRPTGGQLDSDQPARLAAGRPFAECHYDDVFGLQEGSAGLATEIANPELGSAVRQTFSDDFRFLVIYTAPHREAICLEPYTTLPDAFHLEEKGISTGLRQLSAGDRFETRLAILLEEIDG